MNYLAPSNDPEVKLKYGYQEPYRSILRTLVGSVHNRRLLLVGVPHQHGRVC